MRKINHPCEHKLEINNSKYNESHIHLSKLRSIVLAEPITAENSADITALLLYFDALNNEEITLFLHTNGGEVSGLIQIYDVLSLLKSPIRTICLGKAYSAGAVLLAAGTPGHRFAQKHSRIMIHGIQGTFPLPNSDYDLSKNYLSHLKNSNKVVLKILANHTGKTLEEVEKDCKEDQYFTAEQAVKYGLIDGII